MAQRHRFSSKSSVFLKEDLRLNFGFFHFSSSWEVEVTNGCFDLKIMFFLLSTIAGVLVLAIIMDTIITVSYTHLTLPTKRIV